MITIRLTTIRGRANENFAGRKRDSLREMKCARISSVTYIRSRLAISRGKRYARKRLIAPLVVPQPPSPPAPFSLGPHMRPPVRRSRRGAARVSQVYIYLHTRRVALPRRESINSRTANVTTLPPSLPPRPSPLDMLIVGFRDYLPPPSLLLPLAKHPHVSG